MMHKLRWTCTLVTFVSLLSTGSASAQTTSESTIDPQMVGAWELVALIERGIDITEEAGVIGGSNLYVYTFNEDGTFSITEGGRWFESGTWNVNRESEPMQFDHVPLETSGPSEFTGNVSQGIYEVGDDIAKICIADVLPDVRPESFDTNVCMLFVSRRAEGS